MTGAKPLVNVAVAVVQCGDGRVLLAERPRGKISSGYSELPGGKFNAVEKSGQALARKLQEETGIKLDCAYPWITYQHEYSDKRARLQFFRVTAWNGAPHGCDRQRLSWEDPEAGTVAPFLPENALVLKASRLPALCTITNVANWGVAEFHGRLERGVHLIQVRKREHAPGRRAQFARRVIARAATTPPAGCVWQVVPVDPEAYAGEAGGGANGNIGVAIL